MTPHVTRLRAKTKKAAHAYRVATTNRRERRHEWVWMTAATMRAELNALKRKRRA